MGLYRNNFTFIVPASIQNNSTHNAEIEVYIKTHNIIVIYHDFIFHRTILCKLHEPHEPKTPGVWQSYTFCGFW